MTGANGFVGSHVLESLLEDGENEIAITLRTASDTSRIKSHIENNKIVIFYLDKESIDAAITGFKPEIVIHLSVYYKKKHDFKDIEEMFYSNITFPAKILDSMVRNNVPFFINTGTFTEFLIDEYLLTGKNKISPSNLYSATKVAFEEILKFYSDKFGIRAITLKLLAPYGPKDNPKKIIPYLIKCAIKSEKAKTSPGEQKWDFIYVKDVARSYKAAVEFITKRWNKYEAFVIGTGEAFSIKDIAKLISDFHGSLNVEWGALPYDNNETYHVKADTTKAQNLLKWQPVYDLRKGLLETYNYYKEVFNNE
ncbi:NAD(P)-dependent oxidoreductase [Thermoplasmatales archaeon AK]|nr:NAD(P)-dependent oxidoreductase [Thermoplasmatales archaeon AK]